MAKTGRPLWLGAYVTIPSTHCRPEPGRCIGERVRSRSAGRELKIICRRAAYNSCRICYVACWEGSMFGTGFQGRVTRTNGPSG